MDALYKKVMSYLVGEAMAHSDRIKVQVIGFVAIALLWIAHACGACGSILTPEVVTALSITIGTFVVTTVLALTQRDIAAPGQYVAGAAQNSGYAKSAPGDAVPEMGLAGRIMRGLADAIPANAPEKSVEDQAPVTAAPMTESQAKLAAILAAANGQAQ